MKTEKFNLSEKIIDTKFVKCFIHDENRILCIQDVKEFIRLLKEEFLEIWSRWLEIGNNCSYNGNLDIDVLNMIDKLAGEKLK